jgi:hypothetical protein
VFEREYLQIRSKRKKSSFPRRCLRRTGQHWKMMRKWIEYRSTTLTSDQHDAGLLTREPTDIVQVDRMIVELPSRNKKSEKKFRCHRPRATRKQT